MAWRRAIATKTGLIQSHVLVCNVVYGTVRRRLLWDRRRLDEVPPVTFDTHIFATDAGNAYELLSTVGGLTQVEIMSELFSQITIVKDAGNFPDIPASFVSPVISMTMTGSTVTNETPLPTPAPSPSAYCGTLRQEGPSECALDVVNASSVNTVDITTELSTLSDPLVTKVKIYFEPGKFVSDNTIGFDDRTFETEIVCNSPVRGACQLELSSVSSEQSTLLHAKNSHLTVTGMHLTHACIGISARDSDKLIVNNVLFTELAPEETPTQNYCQEVDVHGSGIRIENVTGVSIEDCDIRNSNMGVYLSDVQNAVFINLGVFYTQEYAVQAWNSQNIIFRDSRFADSKDASVVMESSRLMNFDNCSFTDNWNSAIFASRSKEITVADCRFEGNNQQIKNGNNLAPFLNNATVWTNGMHESGSYHNSFVLNMTRNVMDISGFATDKNTPIAYMQYTYTDSVESLFSTIHDKLTLVGGAEYNDYRFKNLFNNTVICDTCGATGYYVYYSNDPTHTNTAVDPPPAPTPAGGIEEEVIEEGGGVDPVVVGGLGAAGLGAIVYTGFIAN